MLNYGNLLFLRLEPQHLHIINVLITNDWSLLVTAEQTPPLRPDLGKLVFLDKSSLEVTSAVHLDLRVLGFFSSSLTSSQDFLCGWSEADLFLVEGFDNLHFAIFPEALDLLKVDSSCSSGLCNIYNLIKKNERVLKDAVSLSLLFCQISLPAIHRSLLTSLAPYAQNSMRDPYDSVCLKISFVLCLVERHALLEELCKFYRKLPEIGPHLDRASQTWHIMTNVIH